MRLQRDSYAPKKCAFDAANVQFLRAHLCKSHPVLQHLTHPKLIFDSFPPSFFATSLREFLPHKVRLNLHRLPRFSVTHSER